MALKWRGFQEPWHTQVPCHHCLAPKQCPAQQQKGVSTPRRAWRQAALWPSYPWPWGRGTRPGEDQGALQTLPPVEQPAPAIYLGHAGGETSTCRVSHVASSWDSSGLMLGCRGAFHSTCPPQDSGASIRKKVQRKHAEPTQLFGQ